MFVTNEKKGHSLTRNNNHAKIKQNASNLPQQYIFGPVAKKTFQK